MDNIINANKIIYIYILNFIKIANRENTIISIITIQRAHDLLTIF